MTTILSILRHVERTERILRHARLFHAAAERQRAIVEQAVPFRQMLSLPPFSPTGVHRDIEGVLHRMALVEHRTSSAFDLPHLWFKPAGENPPALLYAPGGPLGDLVLARLGDEAALDRLACRIPWRLHGTTAERRLMQAEIERRVASTGRGREEVKRTALMAGIALALGEREREQTHRFGRRWVVESAENPRRLPFVPRDARPRWYWRWLCDEAIKAATADLLGRAYPPREHGQDVVIDKELPDLIDPADDPLTALLVDEREQEAARTLRDLLTQAPPGRAAQELFPLIMEQLQTQPEPNFAAADRALGLKAGTSRQRFHQYRQRVLRAI